MGQDVRPTDPSLLALLRDLALAVLTHLRVTAYLALARRGLGATWRARLIEGLVQGQGAVTAANGDTVFASVCLGTGETLNYAYTVSPATPTRLLPADALVMARGHVYRPAAPQ